MSDLTFFNFLSANNQAYRRVVVVIEDIAVGAGGFGTHPRPVKSDAVSPLRLLFGAVLFRR